MTAAATQPSTKGSSVDFRADVLVNDYAGHPFQIDLSNELARRGHAVTHAFCSTNVTPRAALGQSERGPSVVGISTGQGFDKYNIVKRLGAELRYGIKSVRLMRKARPDVCINSNVPVLSVAIITVATRLMRYATCCGCRTFRPAWWQCRLGSDTLQRESRSGWSTGVFAALTTSSPSRRALRARSA